MNLKTYNEFLLLSKKGTCKLKFEKIVGTFNQNFVCVEKWG